MCAPMRGLNLLDTMVLIPKFTDTSIPQKNVLSRFNKDFEITWLIYGRLNQLVKLPECFRKFFQKLLTEPKPSQQNVISLSFNNLWVWYVNGFFIKVFCGFLDYLS